jgi:UDP-N-acetylglucosamine 2-epimerase (non-hydrolysing)
MPEEINRRLKDVISDWFFVTESSGVRNLAAEGAPPSRVHLVGNVMIDTLFTSLARLDRGDPRGAARVS